MAVSRKDAPTRSRILSFAGNKTGPGIPKDKELHRRAHSKADPRLAMNEAQPAAIALEKSNMESLRTVQHKDVYGNPIVDPDLSNPTRYRFERPLDTIRSFEAAIDGSYNNKRAPYARQDESPNGYSRRSSYFGDSRPATHHQGRSYSDHHYNNRGNLSRPDSYAETYANAYANPYGHTNGQQPRGNRSRMNGESAPYPNNPPNVYPQSGRHDSYDNMTAASGSNSHRTDRWGNSTDPSSLNSSLDRLQHQQQHSVEKTHGFNGFGNTPQLDYDQYGHDQPAPPAPVANGYYQGHQSSMPPAIPPKPASVPQQQQKVPSQTPTTEKKKSWFKKRFSKG